MQIAPCQISLPALPFTTFKFSPIPPCIFASDMLTISRLGFFWSNFWGWGEGAESACSKYLQNY